MSTKEKGLLAVSQATPIKILASIIPDLPKGRQAIAVKLGILCHQANTGFYSLMKTAGVASYE